MAYTPTNWQNGDIITAEKMNKIESGLANSGGYIYVHVTGIPELTGEGAPTFGEPDVSFSEVVESGLIPVLVVTVDATEFHGYPNDYSSIQNVEEILYYPCTDIVKINGEIKAYDFYNARTIDTYWTRILILTNNGVSDEYDVFDEYYTRDNSDSDENN